MALETGISTTPDTAINSIFDINMSALRQQNPSLADVLSEINEVHEVELFYSGGEHQDINVAYQGYPLHDVDYPYEQAQELFNTHVPESQRGHNNIIFIYGMGLGYLLNRVFSETKSLIIVYEPHIDVLRTTLELVDFSDILQSPRVKVVSHKNQILWAVTQFYLVGDNITLLPMPSYENQDPETLVEVLREVKSSLYANLICQRTAIVHLATATNKALINMSDLVKYPDIGMVHQQFGDRPGVLISAGPSLDKPGVMEALKRYRDKLLLVCVGQAAQTLDRHGIVPDFVVILESKNVSNQLAPTSYCKDANLVVLPQTHEAMFELPTKRKFIAFGHKDVPSIWLSQALDRDFAPYPHNGTVSITGLILLQNCGCKNIFLLGQDLAFPEGKMYSDDSIYKNRRVQKADDGTYEEAWDEAEMDKFVGDHESYMQNKAQHKATMKALFRNLTHVKGWNGEDLLTYPTYDTFRKAFEYLIKVNPNNHVVNCSEGGAFIEFCEHLPFIEALNKYDIESVEPQQSVETFLQEHYQETQPYTEPYQKVYSRIMADKEVLAQLRELTDHGTRTAKEALKEYATKKAWTNSFRSRLKTMGAINEQLEQLTKEQPLINAYMQQEMFLFAKAFERKITMDDTIDESNISEATIESLKNSQLLFQAIDKASRILAEAFDTYFVSFPASPSQENE